VPNMYTNVYSWGNNSGHIGIINYRLRQSKLEFIFNYYNDSEICLTKILFGFSFN